MRASRLLLALPLALLAGPAAPVAGQDAFGAALEIYRAAIDRPPIARRLAGMEALALTRDVRAVKIFADRYARPRVPKDHERYLLARMCGQYLDQPRHVDALFDFLMRNRDDADGWLWFQGLRGAVRQPDLGRVLEWIESDRANPFTRAGAFEALVEAGRREALELVPRLFAKGPPKDGMARILLVESAAAALPAGRGERTQAPFQAAAGALIDLLRHGDLADRTRLVVARHLARALGESRVSLDADYWAAVLALKSVADPGGRASVASPRFMGLEATGQRVVYLIDLSDSMLDPLSEEELALTRRVPTGGADDFPWGEVKNRFDFAREHLRRSLRDLSPDVRFAIVGFGDAAETFRTTKSLVPATHQNVVQAIRELDEIGAKKDTTGKDRPYGVLRGDTNLHGALLAAFQITTQGRVTGNEHVDEAALQRGADTIFLLSDGRPTRDDFMAYDTAEPGRVTTDAEKGRTEELDYRRTGNFFGPYRVPANLLADLARMNLFRKAEIHTISMGDADLSLMHRIASLGLGRYRNLGGNGVLRLDGRSALEVALPVKPAAFTLECWVRAPEGRLPAALLADSEESGMFWKAKDLPRPGAVLPGPDGPVRVAAGPDFPWNRWVHVAMTWDGAVMRFFVDGKPAGEAGVAGFAPGPGSFFVGAAPDRANRPRWFFGGWIDEVRLSDKVVYAGEFTPAAVLERGSSTLLLLHFDGDGETLFGDAAPGSPEVRPHGSPGIQSAKR